MLRRPLRAGLLGLLALAACEDGGGPPGVGPGLFPDAGPDRGPVPVADRGLDAGPRWTPPARRSTPAPPRGRRPR
ncbi:MAG: hypothetical protein H6706_25235 [Myxococcales bacterium]|nr:hypothetical protein [Myxococcales bacterium]